MRALLGGWNAWLESRGEVEEAVMPAPQPTPAPLPAPPANSSGDAPPKTHDTPGATTAPAKKATKSRAKRRRARG